MLSGILHAFRQRRQLARYVKQIHRYLDARQSEHSALGDALRDLRRQRTLITDDQVAALQRAYMNERAYFTGDTPFGLSPAMAEFEAANRAWMASSDRYRRTAQRFTRMRDAFHQQLRELDAVQLETNQALHEHGRRVQEFLQDTESRRRTYIPASTRERWEHTYRATAAFLRDGQSVPEPEWQTFLAVYGRLSDAVAQWNQEYIQRGLQEYQAFFDAVDGKALDDQQRRAVLTDDDYNLVLAGAGSGKTLTIAAKVKFLVEYQGVDPAAILLLAFTNKAAGEMQDRITGRLGIPVDVMTFHKLGLGIVARARGRKPDIVSDLDDVVREYLNTRLDQDPAQMTRLLHFFGYYLQIPPDLDGFASLGAYREHCRAVDFETFRGKVMRASGAVEPARDPADPLRSMQGERVKSLEEVMIANFLFLHGVDYRYEAPYPYATADETHRQYRPDFYLPDYDLYIEHFGVNAAMRAPWLSAVEERKYLEGMAWKRQLHRDHGTTLIESFSFYHRDGVMLAKLTEQLRAHDVVLLPRDVRTIFHAIWAHTDGDYVKQFVQLVTTFVQLFKSNGFTAATFDTFRRQNQQTPHPFMRDRAALFFDVVQPLFQYYEDHLHTAEALDFNDMINDATTIVLRGDVTLPYQYIMVDEYQDISQSRFHLIQAIQQQTGAKVFGVGDDWQSIYRFAGADIELFTRFGAYWGPHAFLKIEQTHRNAQELVDVAGAFIMKNPHQYTKALRATTRHPQPIVVMGYARDVIATLEQAIAQIADALGPDADILLLGRNNADIAILNKAAAFTPHGRHGDGRIRYRRFPQLRLRFVTVHGSKGLEADAVILLNASNQVLGFPSRMAEDQILSWVLTGYDTFPFAEERRLFYVALTRTRTQVIILAPQDQMSPFVQELMEAGVPFYPSAQAKSVPPACPKCKTGHLVERRRGTQTFVGCTNFPVCDKTFKDVDILHHPIPCPQCGGYMVQANGRYGRFYRCTNYPQCQYTEDARQTADRP